MVQILFRRELGLPAMPNLPLVLCILLTRIFRMLVRLCSSRTKVALRSSKARPGSSRWGSGPIVKRPIRAGGRVAVDLAVEIFGLQDWLWWNKARVLLAPNSGADITALDPSSKGGVGDVGILIEDPHLVRQLRL